MKKLLMLLAALFLFTGCMIPGAFENINTYKPDINEEKTAFVGDTFFVHVEETVQKYASADGKRTQTVIQPDGTRFDLVVVELNDQKIGLQYSEYVREVNYVQNPMSLPGGPGAVSRVAGPNWLIKQGFNKRFDYAIADKVIRFQGYEFEIIGMEKGQLKYKRIK